MLLSLASLMARLSGTSGSPPRFDDGDYRLAAAALLVHAVTADGDSLSSEHARLTTLLREGFDLDAATAEELFSEATVRAREVVGLDAFTGVLKRALSPEDHVRIVDMMWDIVFADGRADELEEGLVSRAAELLGVPVPERLRLRREAQARSNPAGEE